MTFKQRLIAVITCCVLGYVLEIAGSLTLLGGASPKNLRTFAVLYVLGNVVAIMATIFWVGPKFMCKQMFKRSRRCAAVFYLFMLVTVIVLACLKVHVLIVLTALVVEIFSAVWYSASYLPKGRWLILQCCKMSCFKPCPEILAPVERSLPII
ncbi:Got1/Sft2-like family-domain-containing protein [Pelagophyceae sp. CCMP2097]|nr:Got1/Sft2-like family-domain-containing protein [Pelagophyceae sp. CCMP2097]